MTAAVDLKVIGYAVVPLIMAWIGNHLAAAVHNPKRQRMYRVVFLLLAVVGISVTLIVEIEAERSHAKETQDHHKDIEILGGDLQKAETARQVDIAKLATRLEDYAQIAQFAPAIMKLAQTSAEYSRKQYETKLTSKKKLREFTADVVRRMRDAEREHALRQNAISDKYRSQWRQGMTDAQRSQLWNAETQEEQQESLDYEHSFKANILGDAIYARNELLKRLGPQPDLPPMERANLIVFRGILAGASPVSGAATYLEQLAKKLSR